MSERQHSYCLLHIKDIQIDCNVLISGSQARAIVLWSLEGRGILIHEQEGVVLNQCWIMQRMNKNIKRSRRHLTKMILSLIKGSVWTLYWTYGLMTCVRIIHGTISLATAAFSMALSISNDQRKKFGWLFFPCLLTALIRIPLNVMFERAQVWFLLFTYPREHDDCNFLYLKWRRICNVLLIVIWGSIVG